MKIGVNWNLQLRLQIAKLTKELELKTIRLRIAERKLIKYENRISRTG
tara:strand:+ start:482 stop:625 length:144 start_codon:yes stop_codon:yes gene_type:complete